MKLEHMVVMALMAGCATPKPPSVSAAEAFGAGPSLGDSSPAPRERPSPEKWAKAFLRPGECAAGAKVLIEQVGRPSAWAHMKACTARSDYGLLQSLLDDWMPELKNKPESAGIIAQVIANRGGTIGADLQLVQRKRLQIFELNAALAQPEAYKGRYLLFVGRIERFKTAKGRTDMIVMQRARGADESRVFSGATYGESSSYSASGSDRYGSSKYAEQGSFMSGRMEARVTATFEDTGQQVITRLADVDPFLAVNRTFVFLTRFDGAKRADSESSEEDEEPRTTALVSLVSYHPLNEGGTVAW